MRGRAGYFKGFDGLGGQLGGAFGVCCAAAIFRTPDAAAAASWTIGGRQGSAAAWTFGGLVLMSAAPTNALVAGPFHGTTRSAA
jgi:hypothetical protein